jgi:hypothetical protein
MVAAVSPPTGVVPGAGGLEGAEAGVSPATGAVPRAGGAVGVFEAGALDGGATGGADCAHEFVASETARASPASAAAWEVIRTLRMTSPPAQFHSRSMERGGLSLTALGTGPLCSSI